MMRKLIALLLVAATLIPGLTPLAALAAEPVGDHPGNLIDERDFRLEAYNTPGHGSGQLRVTWQGLGENWAYRYFQREADGGGEWEERSTKYGRPIEVLNITANGSEYLANWLRAFPEEAGANGARVNVTSVTQNTFNGNPDYYLTGGRDSYIYDVVVIGFADLNGGGNGGKQNAVAALEKFITAGRGVLFGHDTFYDVYHFDGNSSTMNTGGDYWRYQTQSPGSQWYNDHGGNENVWISKAWGYGYLGRYVGVIPGVSADAGYWTTRYGSRGTAANNGGDWVSENIEFHGGGTGTGLSNSSIKVSYVQVTDGGFLTTYPNELPLGTVLTVPQSHVNGTAASGKEWMTYVQDREGTRFPASTSGGYHYQQHVYEFESGTYSDSGYLVSHQNAALIQTGHANGLATRDEVAVLVNTMYHLAQLTSDNELDDASALDKAAPDRPDARLAGLEDGLLSLDIHAGDNGTGYQVYVEALDQEGIAENRKSDIVEQTSTTGTRGYLYLVSEKTAGEITMDDLAEGDGLGGHLPRPAPGADYLDHQAGTGASLRLDPRADGGKYLHLAAYDYASNLSEISTYAIDEFGPAVLVQIIDGAGAAISGAQVMMDGRGVVTGENGLALFTLDRGDYALLVSRDGYSVHAGRVAVNRGYQEIEVVLTAGSLGGIYGRVLEERGQGQAIPGATVQTADPGGARMLSDSAGYYVLAALEPGVHAVVAHKTGYAPRTENLTVQPGAVTPRDFYLQDTDEDIYFIYGRVTDEAGDRAVAGAEVTDGGDWAGTALTDSGGHYVLTGYPGGAEVSIHAQLAGAKSAPELVRMQNANQRRDLALRSTFQVLVSYVDRETGAALSTYIIPTSRGAAPFEITAGVYPGYRLVSAETVDIDPATVPLDEHDRYGVEFLYTTNMAQVTVRALLADGSPVSGFTPFTVQAEVGAQFIYNSAPDIPGHIFAGHDGAVTVAQGENTFTLRYYRATGNMSVKAVDRASGDVLGAFDLPLDLGESYTLSGEGGPTAEKFPALRHYTLNLAESYIGSLGTDTYVFTGEEGAVPDAVYLFDRKLSTVSVELRMAASDLLLAGDECPAPQGETFTYTLIQAQELLEAAVADPGQYEFVTRQNQKVFVEGDETLVFYLQSGLDTVTLDIHYMYCDEADMPQLITSGSITGLEGETHTVFAAEIAGWALADETGRREVVLEQGMEPLRFYYTRDLVTLTVQAVDRDGAELPLPAEAGTIRVARHVPYVLYAPGVPGYRAEAYVIDGQEIAGNLVSFDGDGMADDRTVRFIYDREGMADFAVTVPVTGLLDGEELYRYDAVFETDSGEQTILAFPLQGHQVVGPDRVTVLIGETAQPAAVKFEYVSLDTHVTVRLEDEGGGLLESFNEAALAGGPFTCRAPDLEHYYLVSPSSIGRIDRVAGDGSDVITFVYRVLSAELVLVAMEGDGGGPVIRLTSVDTEGWTAGTYTVEAADLTADRFTYSGNALAPGDETGLLTVDYVPGETQFIQVYYTKDMVTLTVQARERDQGGNLLASAEHLARGGEAFSVPAPHVDNYDLISQAPISVIPDGDMQITFLYKKAEGAGGEKIASLTVQGVDGDGKVLYEEVSPHRAGDVVTVQARELEGYDLDDEPVKSITIAGDSRYNLVVFRYTQAEAPAELETHLAYVNGYPDGAFGPEKNLTRAEAAMLFFGLIEDGGKHTPRENPYTDVPGDQWYAQAVLYLSAEGILTGYGDRTFGPEQWITRAEMAALCSRFFEMAGGGEMPFPDVPEDHWAIDYIRNAYHRGWIEGYTDGAFAPERQITRAETVALVNRVLDRKIHREHIPDSAVGYTDVTADHWAYTAVIEASNDHQCGRQDDGYELWTRSSLDRIR